MQINIRFDSEQRKHLIQHIPVLARYANFHLYPFALPESQDQWAQFDRFWPCTENYGNLCQWSNPFQITSQADSVRNTIEPQIAEY
jgi:hypothetical protein